jgi:site-specific DNA recombinase
VVNRAVVYARVSSQEQADEGFSIPAQLKLLRAYAADRELTVTREFVDVETAKSAGRPGFDAMVEFVRRAKGNVLVLVEKTDRLYRNLRDYVTLDELGPEIHFVKENFVLSEDSRSTEKLMHGIKVLMAKNYVDNLSEETSKGMLEKAEQGTYPSWAPLGYLNVRIGDERTVVVDPHKGPLVRRMFEWYATGSLSLEAVRQRVTQAGLTGRRGQPLSKSTVSATLKNLFYTGLFVWKGKTYEGDHQPLISTDLYQRTQDAFRKDGKPSRRKSHVFAYTGLLTCGHCGSAVTAERKKEKYVYYHCTGGRGECPTPYIREEDLEELLGETVRAIVLEPKTVEWMKRVLRESHTDEQAYHDEQVAALERRRAAIQEKMDRAYEDLLDGKISEDLWQRKSADWRDQQVGIRAAMEDHERANACYFDEGFRILGLASRAHDLWLTQEQGERRKLLNLLLSNCSFDGESLRATYRKPFCWIAEGHQCSDWLPLVDELRKWMCSEECRELAEAV